MNKVKLVSLRITRLYSCYNYNVDFNPDVTFIYGENGCGKTTILNITEAIITGQLYKLFAYPFEEIELVYNGAHNAEKQNAIGIENKGSTLKVSFAGEEYTVQREPVRNELDIDETDLREYQWRYSDKYPFLDIIRKTFNYVYLPLNRALRSNGVEINPKKMFYYRHMRERNLFDNDIEISLNSRDIAMMQVEELVNRKQSEMMARISSINDGFRNEILKSLLEVNKKKSFIDVLRGFTQNTIEDLQRTKTNYIKILKELDILSKEEEDNFIRFFDDFIDDFNIYLKENPNSQGGITVDLVMKYQEIEKMKEIVNIADKIERKKSKIREPMATFIDTMNTFIGTTQEEKKIVVNPNGRMGFKTKFNDKLISIQNLSSGEKQLLTFIANLIFNVKGQRSGIFVVDEPELSLHLSWQKMFVDSLIGINNNIQLIFATHAPEIIGARRDKMFKLNKQYVI